MLKSNKHKAEIKNGTGRDGTKRAALLLESNKFSASSYGRYENEEGKENPAVGRYVYIIRRRLGRFWAFLMANMWLKGRYSECIALHCIALHRAKRFLKLPNEDEEMEIEVLLTELHTYECMYICTPHIACIIYIHEETKIVKYLYIVHTQLLCIYELRPLTLQCPAIIITTARLLVY